MDRTSAERQRRYRERRRQSNQALINKLAALEARVAQLEAELTASPKPAPRKPPGRQTAADAALRRERDELAERLARIEAYQPGIAEKARAWVEQVDAAPARRTKR